MKNKKFRRIIQYLTVILIVGYSLASSPAQRVQPVRIKATLISNGTSSHQSSVHFRAMSIVGQNVSSPRLVGSDYVWISGYIVFHHDPITNVNPHPVFPIPLADHLYQNYPNPFNPETIIQYDVSKESEIHLFVYNVLGQQVKTLVHEKKSPGVYRVSWSGMDDHGQKVESGLYFIMLKSNDSVETRKMIYTD